MDTDNISSLERIGLHSHIKGLGESNDGIKYNKDGFVAQIKARKALLYVKRLVENNKSGKIIFLKGPSGTGKSALAFGLSKSLGNDFIFNNISSSEIYSKNLSKAEALRQNIRKTIGLKIKENVRVIEGEVVSISSSKIALKTIDMESVFEIGSNMREQIEREKVCVGDIIQIIKERGKIIKLGITVSKHDPQLLGDIKFLPCPEGELFKVEEDIQYVSLHDIDAINSKTHGYLTLFGGQSSEISCDVREEVNDKVKKWGLEGKAELKRGVLFIDEAQRLDTECFNFLNKVLEDSYSPIIILSYLQPPNKSSLEVPRDFLDKCLVISTETYTSEDIKNILMNVIKNPIDQSAINKLAEIGSTAGIRYMFDVLALSEIRRKKLNKEKVDEDDVNKVAELFLDEERGKRIFK